jgi:hypothetical protein
MHKVNSVADLKKQIAELEIRSKRQEEALKEGLKSTGESIKQTLKPANLIKSGLDTVRHTPSIKTIAINTFIGLVAGYISRRFIVGKSHSVIRKTLGVIVQAGITKMVHNKLPDWQNKAANMIAKQKVLKNPAKITVR